MQSGMYTLAVLQALPGSKLTKRWHLQSEACHLRPSVLPLEGMPKHTARKRQTAAPSRNVQWLVAMLAPSYLISLLYFCT